MLVERNDKLYGRGSTDDKAPVLGWLHAINAYKGVGEEVTISCVYIYHVPTGVRPAYLWDAW